MRVSRRDICGAAVTLALLGAGKMAAATDLSVQVRNGAGAPLADAIVYATPQTPAARRAPVAGIIDQVKLQFVPRVSVLQVGTAVSFPNSDNVRHSVYSFSPAKIFTLNLYSGKPSSPVVFDKPGIVVLGCNIHDQMLAWALVLDTAFYARTDSSGAVTLTNLPAGEYILRAWHEPMSQEQPGEALHIDASSPAARTLRLEPDTADAPKALH